MVDQWLSKCNVVFYTPTLLLHCGFPIIWIRFLWQCPKRIQCRIRGHKQVVQCLGVWIQQIKLHEIWIVIYGNFKGSGCEDREGGGHPWPCLTSEKSPVFQIHSFTLFGFIGDAFGPIIDALPANAGLFLCVVTFNACHDINYWSYERKQKVLLNEKILWHQWQCHLWQK